MPDFCLPLPDSTESGNYQVLMHVEHRPGGIWFVDNTSLVKLSAVPVEVKHTDMSVDVFLGVTFGIVFVLFGLIFINWVFK